MHSRRLLAAAALLASAAFLYAQTRPAPTDQEKAISARMGKLRSLPDPEWKKAVGEIAGEIQQLPPNPRKAGLIGELGNLVTEGDAGHETLQTVADTMASVLQDSPNPQLEETLAQLVRYEHVEASLDTPGFRSAVAKLEAADRQRETADFTLDDLQGHPWTLKDLRGKVVLVNFWATWCPPCRKEMPDMETLYERLGPRGLVILAISDENTAKVQPFIAEHQYTYPILLDPGRKVNKLFGIEGIPKSFLYNREGKLVAEGIDRRTEAQFVAMLKQAGME